MESVQHQVQNKLQLLFNKILEPNFEFNNFYGLLAKLSKNDEEDKSILENVSLISNLIFEALNHIKSANPPVHKSVREFVYQFLAIVAQNEVYFTKLWIYFKAHENITLDMQEINSKNLDHYLRVAYMEVALAVVKHNGGRLWILDSELWKKILEIPHDKQSTFVERQKYNFFKNLLWSLNDVHDDEHIRVIVSGILKPIYDFDYAHRSLSVGEEAIVAEQIKPTMDMLIELVTEEGRIESPTLLMNILIDDFSICSSLGIFSRLRNNDVLLLKARLHLYFCLAKIFLTKPLSEKHEYVSDDFIDFTGTYFNTIHRFIESRQPIAVLDFCVATVFVWTSVFKGRAPEYCFGDDESTELKILILGFVPTLVYMNQDDGDANSVSDEKVNELIIRFLNINCEHTSRAAYALRDLMLDMNLVKITLQSSTKLYSNNFSSSFSHKQANLAFQTLYYILTMYDRQLRAEDSSDVSQDKDKVMTDVVCIMRSLLKDNNITWTESLDIIGLYNLLYQILKKPNLSCMFTAIALTVIKVIVQKFLTPNLSLLLESKPGSDSFGKLIHLRLHDVHCEVQESALELLLVCTNMAYIKFPPFQSLLHEHRLINEAAAFAVDVKCNLLGPALHCVAAATKIPKLWEELVQDYPNILKLLIGLLKYHDGFVRNEASKVLFEVYQNVKLTNEFKLVLYEQMASSAIFDCHRLIKLNALKFWKSVICRLFSDQGMLDGSFPPFSKETGKIVTLNLAEEQQLMLKLLDELASIGCLTVLVTLLDEETKVDVLDLALTISNELYDILSKYKIQDLIKPDPNEIRNVNELIKRDEDNPTHSGMNVVEEIDDVNVDDLNLLANTYENQMKLQPRPPIKSEGKQFKCASAYLFVSHLKSKDFKAILEQKQLRKKGIRSVSSHLDYILGL